MGDESLSGDGVELRRDRREEEWEIRLRPDRTMRGFGSTDFGERTSRLIFMSSSHDLSSPQPRPSLLGSFRKRLRNSYPHTHFFGAFFCGKDFFGGSALGEFGESAGEKKTKLFPRLSILLGKTIFSRPNIWSHTDRSHRTDDGRGPCLPPDSFLPSQVLFP